MYLYRHLPMFRKELKLGKDKNTIYSRKCLKKVRVLIEISRHSYSEATWGRTAEYSMTPPQAYENSHIYTIFCSSYPQKDSFKQRIEPISGSVQSWNRTMKAGKEDFPQSTDHILPAMQSHRPNNIWEIIKSNSDSFIKIFSLKKS